MRVEIKGELKEAKFINRINRFIGEIEIDGVIHKTHVANTGRMRELLTPGAKIIVRYVEQDNRKTNYDLLMVYHNGILVSIDSKLPNFLLEKALIENHIPQFHNYKDVKREVTFGRSRFDLFVHNGKNAAFIETKCVTYVRQDGIASFPDAPTERGTKHVLELIDVMGEGMRGAVFFIIQREDAIAFTPNHNMDPKFAEAVLKAYQEGVEFYAYICKVTANEIKLVKEVPIQYT
ncbi:MAG: DNA/RNA nuclease SfsA [Thermotaleaceae bacterium]